MAKVYGIHLISLRLGVDPAEFEEFVVTTLPRLSNFEGWKTRVLKGDRGDRPGQYAVLIEIEDEATRDRFARGDGVETPDFERFVAEHPEMVDAMKKWSQYATPYWEGIGIYTDYTVLAEAR